MSKPFSAGNTRPSIGETQVPARVPGAVAVPVAPDLLRGPVSASR